MPKLSAQAEKFGILMKKDFIVRVWDDSSKSSQGLFLDLFYRVESKNVTLLFEGILDSIAHTWDQNVGSFC